ncbi:MAG: YqaA family protein [Pseudomonadota bacterium]
MSRLEALAGRLVNERAGRGAMFAASFLESTILPIPLETVAAPLMAAHPRRAAAVATTILLGCLAGALVFYLAARAAFDPVVAPALAWLGLQESFETMRGRLDREGLFWAVFLISLTPAPFQLATLGAGAAGGSVWVFLAAVGTSRAIRYYGLALLAARFGPGITRALGGPGRVLIWGAAALLGLYLAAALLL